MTTNGTAPKITFYTNHGCPWAHRAHITLKELGLPYEEVIIDLEKPREPWYLEVNPVSHLKPQQLVLAYGAAARSGSIYQILQWHCQ